MRKSRFVSLPHPEYGSIAVLGPQGRYPPIIILTNFIPGLTEFEPRGIIRESHEYGPGFMTLRSVLPVKEPDIGEPHDWIKTILNSFRINVVTPLGSLDTHKPNIPKEWIITAHDQVLSLTLPT
ncbi:hypothetical protein ES703_125229 [subsurface metagenome]